MERAAFIGRLDGFERWFVSRESIAQQTSRFVHPARRFPFPRGNTLENRTTTARLPAECVEPVHDRATNPLVRFSRLGSKSAADPTQLSESRQTL